MEWFTFFMVGLMFFSVMYVYIGDWVPSTMTSVVMTLILFIFLTIITPEYIPITTTSEIYKITQNGEKIDTYAKISNDMKFILINNGEEQKYRHFNRIIPTFQGNPRIDCIEYTWDDDKFPYNFLPTLDKESEYYLYAREIN